MPRKARRIGAPKALSPPTTAISAPASRAKRRVRVKRSQPKRRGGRRKSLSLSKPGMDFLKCALAPPDFGMGTFQGIPDHYDGRVLTKSWTYTGALPALTDGLPTYIVQVPVPGVAYLYGQVVAGVLNLTPVYYPDYLSLFPAVGETQNVESFRYAGQAMEVIPTVNAMTWTGSVQVFRGQATFTTFGTALAGGGMGMVMGGLTSLVNSAKPDAVHPFNLGCFCTSRQTQPDFPFHDIHPATNFNELAVTQGTGSIVVNLIGSTIFVGLGSMETIVFKIPSYTAASNALTLRTWCHQEYQISSGSSLYEYAHISPPLDPAAMALVKKAFNELQLCVPFYENDGLWSKVLAFIKRTSEALSFVPGPVGEVAMGVGMISSAIENLVF